MRKRIGLRMRLNKRAFTLIELLVVIGIIAILALLSVVLYNKYTARAQFSGVVTALSYIEDQAKTYRSTQGRWPDSGADLGYSVHNYDNYWYNPRTQVHPLVEDIEFFSSDSAGCNYLYMRVFIDHLVLPIQWQDYIEIELGENISTGVIAKSCVIKHNLTPFGITDYSSDYVQCQYENWATLESAAGNNSCP